MLAFKDFRDFMDKLVRNTKEAEGIIDEWVKSALKRCMLPTKDDIDLMEQKIEELERKIKELEEKQKEDVGVTSPISTGNTENL